MLEEHVPEEPVEDEPDLQPYTAEAVPAETRGIAWVIVPALLGALLGAGIGMVQATALVPQGMAALQGAIVGLLAGGVCGLLVWVVFPYKSHNPHAVPAEETKEGEES